MKKGFTLIELLIVIFIIALVATLVIINTNAARKKSRDAKRKADLLTMQSALEQYYTENRSYPTRSPVSWRGNCSGFGGYALSGADAYIPDLSPGFISVLPQEPLQTNIRCYLYRSNGSNYKILAHNINSDYINEDDPMVDPARDTGTWQNNCELAPTNPLSYSVYTPGACGW